MNEVDRNQISGNVISTTKKATELLYDYLRVRGEHNDNIAISIGASHQIEYLIDGKRWNIDITILVTPSDA